MIAIRYPHKAALPSSADMAGYVNPIARQSGEVGSKRRARELGIPFEGSLVFHNAITDFPGVATPIDCSLDHRLAVC